MRVDLKTSVWVPLVRFAAKAALGITLVTGIAVAASGSAQARDGHWSGGHGGGHIGGGGHFGGGGHWGHGGWGRSHWGGGGYWGPSWGLSVGFPIYPRYYDPYYDPYYYPRTVVIERPGYAWPVYNQVAYERAMSAPLGESSSWEDDNSSGTVTTTREGRSGDRYCREFQQSVVIDGKRQQAYGAACQTPDGGWEIVPDNP